MSVIFVGTIREWLLTVVVMSTLVLVMLYTTHMLTVTMSDLDITESLPLHISIFMQLHRHRSSINFGGHDIFARKICMKH